MEKRASLETFIFAQLVNMFLAMCWGLEHRASNPVSAKNLTAIETSTIVKLLRPYVPVGMKRTSSSSYIWNPKIHTREWTLLINSN
jgi:hypothetical protein